MPVEPGWTTANAAAVATAASAALPPDCSTAIPAIVASGWLEATTPLVDRIGERRDSHRIGCSYTLPIYTVPERIQGVPARSQDLTQAPELHLAGVVRCCSAACSPDAGYQGNGRPPGDAGVR